MFARCPKKKAFMHVRQEKRNGRQIPYNRAVILKWHNIFLVTNCRISKITTHDVTQNNSQNVYSPEVQD